MREYNTPEYNQRRALRARFDISVDQYDAMVAAQAGLCAICAEPAGTKRLHVDHDHLTGVIRGLLCTRCNPGLGYFQDDPARLQAAIDYLKRGGAST